MQLKSSINEIRDNLHKTNRLRILFLSRKFQGKYFANSRKNLSLQKK